jgi:hypothetical protein
VVREPSEELDEVTRAKLRLRALSQRHSTTPGGITRLLMPDRRRDSGGDGSSGGSNTLKLAGIAAAAVVAGVVLARFPGVRRAAAHAVTDQVLKMSRRND